MCRGRKKRENREGQIGGIDAQKERCSIRTSVEIDPFKIRYLRHPSFTHNSSYGHKGEMKMGRKEEEETE